MFDDAVVSPIERELLDNVVRGSATLQTARARSDRIPTVKRSRTAILLNLGATATAQTQALVVRHGSIDLRRAA
jgi:hypothetical protein